MDETANCIICKKSLNGEGDVDRDFERKGKRRDKPGQRRAG